ncbi:MAG TPA: hypothetical protein VKV02_01225 [Acidobacteriaceae bacterium]|nr:hypothetical protein [Acidobacteriaceae bacterium]
MVLTWAVVSAALVLVMTYRATLTQHETDQLFLGDEESLCAQHVEHDRILARMKVIRPIYQGLTGAAILMSALIAGIYVAEMLPQMAYSLR